MYATSAEQSTSALEPGVSFVKLVSVMAIAGTAFAMTLEDPALPSPADSLAETVSSAPGSAPVPHVGDFDRVAPGSGEDAGTLAEDHGSARAGSWERAIGMVTAPAPQPVAPVWMSASPFESIRKVTPCGGILAHGEASACSGCCVGGSCQDPGWVELGSCESEECYEGNQYVECERLICWNQERADYNCGGIITSKTCDECEEPDFFLYWAGRNTDAAIAAPIAQIR